MPLLLPGIEVILDAILFDFDGVIVESLDIKTEAFRALFSGEADNLDAIVSLHRRHAGINRLVKFEMIYREILRRPLGADRKAALAARFKELVVERVIDCPMVAGACELLKSLNGLLPLAVVSGTPEEELQEIVRRRGLSRHFIAVRGAPTSKAEIVAGLLSSASWQPQRVLMIGDAIEDLAAARAHDLRFIGRLPPGQGDPFPLGTAVVSDLREIERILMAMS
jgi:HAD superfamily hydrolase (TIGR01549 family)